MVAMINGERLCEAGNPKKKADEEQNYQKKECNVTTKQVKAR
jgi:hypothetical protein